MSRANEGWDFIKVGKVYQYKEDIFVAMVKVLEDNSAEDFYKFKLQVLASNLDMAGEEFDIEHQKDTGGYWNGMLQLYESPEYIPLPLGTPWPYALKRHEFEGIKFIEGGVIQWLLHLISKL